MREAAPGWYDGSLYFNRPQYEFTPEELGEVSPQDMDQLKLTF